MVKSDKFPHFGFPKSDNPDKASEGSKNQPLSICFFVSCAFSFPRQNSKRSQLCPFSAFSPVSSVSSVSSMALWLRWSPRRSRWRCCSGACGAPSTEMQRSNLSRMRTGRGARDIWKNIKGILWRYSSIFWGDEDSWWFMNRDGILMGSGSIFWGPSPLPHWHMSWIVSARGIIPKKRLISPNIAELFRSGEL